MPAAGHGIDRDVDGGGTNLHTHKIHVPLRTDPAAVLTVAGADYHLREAHAYEVNNTLPHGAFNGGARDRIHFIFEVFDSAALQSRRPSLRLPTQPRPFMQSETYANSQHGIRVVCFARVMRSALFGRFSGAFSYVGMCPLAPGADFGLSDWLAWAGVVSTCALNIALLVTKR